MSAVCDCGRCGPKPEPKPGMVRISVEVDECFRCGHVWRRRPLRTPITCPACKSPYWNTMRRGRRAS